MPFVRFFHRCALCFADEGRSKKNRRAILAYLGYCKEKEEKKRGGGRRKQKENKNNERKKEKGTGESRPALKAAKPESV